MPLISRSLQQHINELLQIPQPAKVAREPPDLGDCFGRIRDAGVSGSYCCRGAVGLSLLAFAWFLIM